LTALACAAFASAFRLLILNCSDEEQGEQGKKQRVVSFHDVSLRKAVSEASRPVREIVSKR
jgi:hypothetical protein